MIEVGKAAEAFNIEYPKYKNESIHSKETHRTVTGEQELNAAKIQIVAQVLDCRKSEVQTFRNLQRPHENSNF